MTPISSIPSIYPRAPKRYFAHFTKIPYKERSGRAEREALAYESGNSPDLLEKFYRLTVMTRRRQHNPPQPISWFQSLARTFGNAMQIRLASTAVGRPVASILTLKHRSTITYKYGCSDARFSNLGGTALLFWRTIQEATQEGLVELDLGRSDVDNARPDRLQRALGCPPRHSRILAIPGKSKSE